jgi:predicted MFS family arabinose efflux permease
VLTPRDLLREGNAIMNVGFGIALIAGTALGGVIASGLGVRAGLLIDAASFAIVAVVVAGLTTAAVGHDEHEAPVARLRALWTHVSRHPLLRALLVGEGLALVFFTLILPIEVVYAKRTLGTGDAGFGLLLASWNGGLLAGSLGYVRLGRRSPAALVLGSTAAIGAAYAGLALAGTLWVACLISVVGGIGNGFQWVSVMTLVQEATPLDLQARVVSLLESIGAAMPGIGFMLGGALTAIFSPRTAYAVAGAGALALVVIAALALPRNRLEAEPDSGGVAVGP